jgi:urease accessory protein UreF
MALVANTHGRQWHAVLTEKTVTGTTVITVAVGAVTVRVHSDEALRCYLLAWTQADALGAVFDTLTDVMSAAPGY